VARLQILQLPEGAGDDRPPFVLVIDQASEDTADSLGVVGISTAELVGARTVMVFRETVEIPANDPPSMADDPERAGTTQIVYAHERTRLDLCSALLLSGDTTWRKLVEHVAERQRTVARLLRQLDAAKIKPDLDGA